MKSVEHYICEICGAEYESKEECRECEHCHNKPIEIIKVEYKKNGSYPSKVYIRMSNGQIVEYS